MQQSLGDLSDAAILRFYDDNLSAARSRFDIACRSHDARQTDHPIGSSGDTLRLAQFGPPEAPVKLIILSGLHGIEGYCGAAAQIGILERLTGNSLHVHVILVHGINPTGIREFRRTNADNIDLNRNYLTDHAEAARVDAEDRAIASLFSSSYLSRLPETIWVPMLVARVVRLGGMDRLRKTLAGGQFFDPEALFYGGCTIADELNSLLSALGPLLGNADQGRTIFFDLHSGIGRFGECSLLANGPSTLPLSEIFGIPVGDGHEGPTAVYPARGDVIRGVKQALGLQNACGVTFECGTGPPIATLLALRAANSAQVHFPDSPRAKARARRKMLRAFSPTDPNWRKTYVRRSANLMNRAFAYLTEQAENNV